MSQLNDHHLMKEKAKKIYALGGRAGDYVRAFVLQYDDELLVLDTLFGAGARPILDQIKQIGRSVEDVEHIILTHGHRSHLGGLAKLAVLSGVVHLRTERPK